MHRTVALNVVGVNEQLELLNKMSGDDFSANLSQGGARSIKKKQKGLFAFLRRSRK